MKNDSARSQCARPAGRPSAPRTALAALIFGVGLHVIRAVGTEDGRPPEIRRIRVAVAEAPWYILAAVEGIGPKTARRLAATTTALRAAGFRPEASKLPALGARLLHRASADLEIDVTVPDPPR